MARSRNIMPDKRRITVLVSLLFLLALFMIPYFFVFIPANADNLKRQAFLKLSRAAQNIISKTTDTRNYYLNNISDLTDQQSSEELKVLECKGDDKEQISLLDSIYFQYAGAQGWKILFLQYTGTNAYDPFMHVNIQSLEPFITPCLSSGREIFGSFLLLHYCKYMAHDTAGKILYQDFRQGVEQEIQLDTLLPRHNGIRSPDIQDITMEGTEYKLFSYPFLLGRHRMILCGLLKTDIYNSKIHQIPVGIFYTLVICLTIFFLSLPFLKIFMMNARDRLYAHNLVNGVIFLFAMASFITIIITQLILLWQGRSQVRTNLRNLSTFIEDSLTAELRLAQNEMSYYDSILHEFIISKDTTKLDTLPTRTPYAFLSTHAEYTDTAFKNKNRILSGHAPFYHNADHCSWISEAGQELVRIRYVSPSKAALLLHKPNPDSSKFVNVKTRTYYQDMLKGWKYLKDTNSTVMLAPVQSWASGEFRVGICKYSRTNKFMMELLDTRLYSMVNTVLPAGYGFCLFDEKGNVLIHSDTLKSLRENFIEETGTLALLTGGVKGRQEIESDQVSFYGTSFALHVKPLKQHLLFLAVFYNNDYLEPSNLRILTFSVFFCLLTYGLLILLSRVLYRPLPKTCLYSPMDYYARMIPLKEKIGHYFTGSLVLFIYITLFVIASILGPLIGNDTEYSMLVFGLLSPFNILYATWLLQHRASSSTVRKSILLIVPLFLTGACIFVFSYVAKRALEPFSFWIMEFLLILMLYFIVRKDGTFRIRFRDVARVKIKRMLRWEQRTPEQNKLISYSSFVTLFIFAIAILPSLEYSWFAYNHELWQSLKKEQLEIADGLQKRERTIRSFLRNNQPDFSGKDSNFDMIQYTKGIYPNYKGSLIISDSIKSANKINHPANSEAFYLSIANTINLYYKDPAGLPPLYNSTKDDSLWRWDMDNNGSVFDYSKPKWKIPPMDNPDTPKITLRMFSSIQKGFKIENQLFFVFAGCILLLVLSVYWITKSIARQVFLTRIVADAGSALQNLIGHDRTELWKRCLEQNKYEPGIDKYWRSPDVLITKLTTEYQEFSDAAPTDIVNKEGDFIGRTQELKPVFECIWKNLDDNEKYLLYCLANDGLINHKNESLIYGLMHKNLLVIFDQRIRLVSYSFRDFIISRNNTTAEKTLLAKMQSEASWTYMRTILLVIISSIFIFLFLTQQEVSSKIIALATSLTALLPLVFKFGNKSADAASKK